MGTKVIMECTVMFAGQLYNQIVLQGDSPSAELYNLANSGNVLPIKTTKEGIKYFIIPEE